ncbi:MAG: hypothetical protein WCF82_04730, partial [Microcoleus sp.]
FPFLGHSYLDSATPFIFHSLIITSSSLGQKSCLLHQWHIDNPAVDELNTLAIVLLGDFFER